MRKGNRLLRKWLDKQPQGSRAHLARLCNVDPSTIGKLVPRRKDVLARSPSPDLAEAIERFTGIGVNTW